MGKLYLVREDGSLSEKVFRPLAKEIFSSLVCVCCWFSMQFFLCVEGCLLERAAPAAALDHRVVWQVLTDPTRCWNDAVGGRLAAVVCGCG